MRFAVLGDVHYVDWAGHRRVLAGGGGLTEPTDLQRNNWFVQAVVPDVLREISSARPDFLVQLGDVRAGHCDDTDSSVREMREAVRYVQKVGVPVLYAVGTHDGGGPHGPAALTQVLFRENQASASHLGKILTPPDAGYFAFARADVLFGILDYTTFGPGDNQDRFIHWLASKKEEYRALFLFCHAPFRPIGRPFFSKLPFVKCLEQVFRGVRGFIPYFCAHTHSHTASRHTVGSCTLYQFASTPLGYPNGHLTRIEETVPVWIAQEDSLYWAYQEDAAASWYLVEVSTNAIRVEWHVLGWGVLGSFTWSGEDTLPRLSREVVSGPRLLGKPDPDQVRSLHLRLQGSGCRGGYAAFLNDQPLGYLQRLEYFDTRQVFPLQRSVAYYLQQENVLRVTTGEEEMGIGPFVLEYILRDGRLGRSMPSREIFVTTSRWDDWEDGRVRHIQPGDVVETILGFGG